MLFFWGDKLQKPIPKSLENSKTHYSMC